MSGPVRSQIHFSGQTDCPSFQPHFLKPNFCTSCSKLIDKHTEEAVHSDSAIIKALEFSQKGEKTPSLILERTDTVGALYLGGFKAIMNDEFLVEQNIGAVVNTAKGLENIFGPNYTVSSKLLAYVHLVAEYSCREQWRKLNKR